MDISDESQVFAAIAEVLAKFGWIDIMVNNILVNNAGVNTAKHRLNVDYFPRDE